MNYKKIGQFIANCRKDKNMTQLDLAQKLFISDRTVSRWESGRGMPDTSLIIKLCKELDISVNELLTGEKIKKENYINEAEKNLLYLQEEKKKADRRLLNIEVAIGVTSVIVYLVMIIIAIFAIESLGWRIFIIVFSLISIFSSTFLCIFIEQKAGYYECQKCGHKYIPKYFQVFFSLHSGRTRYMKCPKCHQRSWNKKIVD